MAKPTHLWLTPLLRAEWAHVVAQHVFHKKITTREAQQVSRIFQQDREAGLWIESDLPDTVWETSIVLGQRHAPALGVRTLDTLHVASALELKAEIFWSFDRRQTKLAQAAGLQLL